MATVGEIRVCRTEDLARSGSRRRGGLFPDTWRPRRTGAQVLLVVAPNAPGGRDYARWMRIRDEVDLADSLVRLGRLTPPAADPTQIVLILVKIHIYGNVDETEDIEKAIRDSWHG